MADLLTATLKVRHALKDRTRHHVVIAIATHNLDDTFLEADRSAVRTRCEVAERQRCVEDRSLIGELSLIPLEPTQLRLVSGVGVMGNQASQVLLADRPEEPRAIDGVKAGMSQIARVADVMQVCRCNQPLVISTDEGERRSACCDGLHVSPSTPQRRHVALRHGARPYKPVAHEDHVTHTGPPEADER